MSNPILPRKPAFPGLQPDPPEFIPLAEGDVRRALLACAGPGELFGRKGAAESLAGYYLYRNAKATTFLKVVPVMHIERQSAANAIAGWVARFGVRTSVLLPGFPKRLGDGYAVFSYPYIPGRFAEATASDLGQIGTSLALMHDALAQLPNSAAIKQAAAVRMAMLRNRFSMICLGTHVAGPQPERLRGLFESEAAIFSLLDDAAACQPLHGDLVYGNILFPLEGGPPVLLDFEDTLISWLPTDLDIALALERFALLPAQDEEKAFVLAREMLLAYAAGCGNARFLVHAPGDCLRLLALRSLTTLAELEAAGERVDVAEWEKFFGLYRHTVEREQLLARLESEFRA